MARLFPRRGHVTRRPTWRRQQPFFWDFLDGFEPDPRRQCNKQIHHEVAGNFFNKVPVTFPCFSQSIIRVCLWKAALNYQSALVIGPVTLTHVPELERQKTPLKSNPTRSNFIFSLSAFNSQQSSFFTFSIRAFFERKKPKWINPFSSGVDGNNNSSSSSNPPKKWPKIWNNGTDSMKIRHFLTMGHIFNKVHFSVCRSSGRLGGAFRK